MRKYLNHLAAALNPSEGEQKLAVTSSGLSFQLPEFVGGDFFEARHLITSFADSFAIGISELPVDGMFRAYDLFA